MGFYEDFKKAFQDIVAPEIKVLQAEIRRLDEKIDSGLGRLDEKIGSGLARLDEKIDSGLENLEDKIGLVRNELLAEIRRSDATVAVELKRIDNELRLLREMKDRTNEIEQLKERIFALEERMAA